jgi:alkylation response protein AidB-like acyl-CoA dehydrogenase
VILHAAPRFRSGHGGELKGCSADYDGERYFRDAPLMIVGEGTNEIQRNVIAAQIVKHSAMERR